MMDEQEDSVVKVYIALNVREIRAWIKPGKLYAPLDWTQTSEIYHTSELRGTWLEPLLDGARYVSAEMW